MHIGIVGGGPAGSSFTRLISFHPPVVTPQVLSLCSHLTAGRGISLSARREFASLFDRS